MWRTDNGRDSQRVIFSDIICVHCSSAIMDIAMKEIFSRFTQYAYTHRNDT